MSTMTLDTLNNFSQTT